MTPNDLVLTGLGLPSLAWRGAALLGTTATFLLAAFGLFRRFDPEATGFQLVEWQPWIPEYGIHYFVGVDGISLVLVLLVARCPSLGVGRKIMCGTYPTTLALGLLGPT